MTKIFVSYSRPNESSAQRLYNELQGLGLDVWFDKESLLPGQDWNNEIKQAIKRSDFVILLLSSSSVSRRGYFHKEIRLAIDVLQTIPFGHIYLLPVRLNDCEVPPLMSDIQYVDLFPDWDRGFSKLTKAIESQ